MNLQVCVPYQPCLYNCPMCVARGHKHKYIFDNLYGQNKKKYLRLLARAVRRLDKGASVILTGECDPTQDMNFCKDVISVVRKVRKDIRIELQTRNYLYGRDGDYLDLDVLSYSVVSLRGYQNARNYYKDWIITNRMVILLVKGLEPYLDNEHFDTKGFDQVTFKTLQYSEDPEVNAWIDKYKMSEEGVEAVRGIVRDGISIRVDTSCQDGTGRYYIFRSDGKVYKTWEEGRKTGV